MTPGDGGRVLPRGPHKLSREEVERSQRERLLHAATAAVAEHGYVATSVAEILRRAGVSRATFYAMFSDKQDCFVAAYRAHAELVVTLMEQAVASLADADPLDRLDLLLRVYLEGLRTMPDLARVFLVEVYAAGPEAIEQRRASLERFVDLVADSHRGREGLLGTAPEQRFAAEFLVGAVSSMVTNLVAAGDVEGLARLHEPIMALARRLEWQPHPS